MKKIYCIYARNNSDKVDTQGSSIDSQINILCQVARKKGIKVTQVFTEIGSANSISRPVFTKMVTAVRAGEIDGVLCAGLDRLTRNIAGVHELGLLIEQNNLQIITPHGVIKRGISSVLNLFLPFAFSQADSQMKSERIKRGIACKKAILYVHKSSESQQNISLAEQGKEVRNKCQKLQ